MQQVVLALSLATFEGYLAEIYEVGRQILQSTNKRGCHIGIDISSGRPSRKDVVLKNPVGTTGIIG